MTDNEVIKALEWCSNEDYCNTSVCPIYRYMGGDEACVTKVSKLALDLINRQKAEIGRLHKANGLLKYLKESVHRVEIGGKEEVVDYASEEALHNAITKKINLMSNVQTAKAEAYKEFAERLKEYTHDIVLYGEVVRVHVIDKLLTELTERKEDEGK